MIVVAAVKTIQNTALDCFLKSFFVIFVAFIFLVEKTQINCFPYSGQLECKASLILHC